MAKRRDDLFDDSSMSFGEHLDELRYRLIMSIYWLVGGFIIALIPWPGFGSLSGWSVAMIQRPLTRSLQYYYEQQSVAKIHRELTDLKKMGYSANIAQIPGRHGMAQRELWLFPEDLARLRRLLDGTDPMESNKTVGDLTREAFQHSTGEALLAAVDNFDRYKTPVPDSGATTTPTGEETAAPLGGEKNPRAVPILVWDKLADDPRVKAKSLSMPETFVIFLKAAVFLGILIGSPGIFYHFWSFISAGLYSREKKYVYRFLPFSLFLFFSGAALAFFIIFEMVLSFLLTFNAGMNIDPDPRISEWLKFAMILPLGFGISFQLPLVMFALYRMRIFTIQTYWQSWRISILVIAFLSMMFTPPDPWSMICMLTALISLYFLGILLCKSFPVPAREFDE